MRINLQLQEYSEEVIAQMLSAMHVQDIVRQLAACYYNRFLGDLTNEECSSQDKSPDLKSKIKTCRILQESYRQIHEIDLHRPETLV